MNDFTIGVIATIIWFKVASFLAGVLIKKFPSVFDRKHGY